MSTKKKDATTEQEDTLQSAMELLEKEKNISADVLYDAIEQALTTACEKTFNGRMDNIHVEVDREHCKYRVYADKTIVETDDDVMDPQEDISLREARERHIDGEIGDMVQVDINSRGFGRIATTIAKGVILQKIREEERNSVLSYYSKLEKTVVIGTVERQVAKTYVISLGRSEGVLNEKEQVPGETLRVGDHVKVYILGVHRTPKGGPKIQLSRTHPDMVRRMFEEEVSEIRDGTVEIKSIAREAGSRTKIAVVSNNPNVDPIGACVRKLHSECSVTGQDRRGLRRSRREERKGCRSRLSALPCHRQGGPERTPCREADRLQDRYQERDPGKGYAGLPLRGLCLR